MILDSIRLQNFGVYAGKQSLELSPGKDRPIILIGGLNGGGKTTILDAIQLCLYGSRAQISNRGKRQYKDYLGESIHRNSDPNDGASIRLSFRRLINGKSHTYEVDRSWRKKDKTVQESLEVWRDGQPDSILSHHWDEYMEQTLPASLAQLFFFDGEQIKDLADHECASRLLKTAIQTLLGLNIVDQLEEDLLTLEKRKATETKPKEIQNQVAELDKEIIQLQTLADSAAQERAALVNQTSLADKHLNELQERFRLEGGELYVRRDELEENFKVLKAEKESSERALREIMAGPLPLILIEPLLTETLKQAECEIAVKQAVTIEKAERERDQKILTLLQRELSKEVLAKVKHALEGTRPQRTSSDQGQQFLHPTDEMIAELSDLLGAKTFKAREGAALLAQKLDASKEHLARVETQLAKVPDADSIAKLQKEITGASALVREKNVQLALLDDKLRANHTQEELKSKELAKLLEIETEQGLSVEHDFRIIRFSSKVRNTLDNFREKVIRKHVGRLESLILESFWQLLRKQQLISALSINAQTFEITLRDVNGKEMPFDRLSAGERQLLATAILWGLAKASGRPLPTIIDTPLGRLDSSHRRHLVERYFPFASHQVVLLSTDQEIVSGNLEAIEPFVQMSYQLVFDQASSTTQVLPGYFKS